MRKYLPSVRRLAIICFVFALALAGWAKPALSFHKERKIVKQVVDIHKEIQNHLDEGKLDWHHLGEELIVIAKPVRDLGHHDKVDLFKPLEDAVRSEDEAALEKAFQKIFFYLMRENLHRSEDSAGNLEKTMTGFIMNARMAYGSLVDKPGSANKQVDRIFQEMEMIAKEAGTMKARMLEKTKELEAQLSGNLGH
jgi:hypothetical protein